ncbi:hypothetical protein OAB00_01320 [Akkermansiaceae bacterium]|nr:hypothetical protein [Akkermansiaceae bacterium]
MQSESQIEKAVSTHARKLGFYVRKFSSPNNRGVPDKLFISPHGFVFFVEFKAPKKKPTDIQQDEINQIQKRNAVVFVIDDTSKGKTIIESTLLM